jgi:hypothetical protein
MQETQKRYLICIQLVLGHFVMASPETISYWAINFSNFASHQYVLAVLYNSQKYAKKFISKNNQLWNNNYFWFHKKKNP